MATHASSSVTEARRARVSEMLEKFGVPFELTIVSAHRTPHRLVEYATSAHKRGLRAIIAGAGTMRRDVREQRRRGAGSPASGASALARAGAGGAAHLPGMVAALTPLPVVGVPVALKHLDGVDSLHSIVQMPRGVPVATVAIDNATNAGLLVVRLLGAFVPRCALFSLECETDEATKLIVAMWRSWLLGARASSLQQAMLQYQADMDRDVHAKVAKLETQGWKDYKP